MILVIKNKSLEVGDIFSIPIDNNYSGCVRVIFVRKEIAIIVQLLNIVTSSEEGKNIEVIDNSEIICSLWCNLKGFYDGCWNYLGVSQKHSFYIPIWYTNAPKGQVFLTQGLEETKASKKEIEPIKIDVWHPGLNQGFGEDLRPQIPVLTIYSPNGVSSLLLRRLKKMGTLPLEGEV
jgi:hypothetical protein